MTTRDFARTVCFLLLCSGLPVTAQEPWPSPEPAPDTRDPGKAPDPATLPDMPGPTAPAKNPPARKKAKKPRKPDPDLSRSALSFWTGLGSWSATTSDGNTDSSATSLQYSVGIDARIAFGGSVPLGGIVSYELSLGLVGTETTEVDDASRLEFDNDITHAAHLLDAGLCGVFVVNAKHFVLYPFAAYTLYLEGIDRDHFDQKRGPPGALAGLDEVKDRIAGHGFSVGAQMSARFFRWFGMDATIAYSYLVDVSVDRIDGPGERAGVLSTDAHMLRIVPRIWFEVIPEVLTIGTRGGIGLRYIDGETRTRNLPGPSSSTFAFPNTFISSSLIGVELRLLF